MSTVYVAIPQPLTTKYLKKGGSGDIDQLVEDVEQLKTEVGQIEEVDDEQNTDITTLKSDVQTINTNITNLQSTVSTQSTQIIGMITDISNLQTSDTAQNAGLDKLRHQLILMCCYSDDNKKGYMRDGKIITSDSYLLDVSNFPALQLDICVYINNGHGGGPGSLMFDKRANVNQCLNNYYYLYPSSTVDSSLYSKYGFGIFNGLGENVLTNNKIIKAEDVANGAIYLYNLLYDYGTDYYKQHYTDTYEYSLLDANVEVITNIKQWMTDKLSTSDFESMTNLKTWVESKAGGGTPTTILKCPVDLMITGYQTVSKSMKVKITDTTCYMSGVSVPSTGFYIAFHYSLTASNIISAITLLTIKSGQAFPYCPYGTGSTSMAVSWYKVDGTFNDEGTQNFLEFVMSDGSVVGTLFWYGGIFDSQTNQYMIHVISNTICFNQLLNNITTFSNQLITTADQYQNETGILRFTGTEGSFTEKQTINPSSN